MKPAMNDLQALNEEIITCRRCPRLVEWRERVALEKRKSFASETYWGRAVPAFGDPLADRLIVGLAPAAHGANRTGRMFTGDRSGDWLFRALHKAGVANQPTSTHANDGLVLTGVLMAAVAHCAPPDNKPTSEEISNCHTFLTRTLAMRPWKAILCLGHLSWDHVHRTIDVRKIPFGHGIVHSVTGDLKIVGCYHPSQQNTFTGRLTEEMLDSAIATWLS